MAGYHILLLVAMVTTCIEQVRPDLFCGLFGANTAEERRRCGLSETCPYSTIVEGFRTCKEMLGITVGFPANLTTITVAAIQDRRDRLCRSQPRLIICPLRQYTRSGCGTFSHMAAEALRTLYGVCRHNSWIVTEVLPRIGPVERACLDAIRLEDVLGSREYEMMTTKYENKTFREALPTLSRDMENVFVQAKRYIKVNVGTIPSCKAGWENVYLVWITNYRLNWVLPGSYIGRETPYDYQRVPTLAILDE